MNHWLVGTHQKKHFHYLFVCGVFFRKLMLSMIWEIGASEQNKTSEGWGVGIFTVPVYFPCNVIISSRYDFTLWNFQCQNCQCTATTFVYSPFLAVQQFQVICCCFHQVYGASVLGFLFFSFFFQVLCADNAYHKTEHFASNRVRLHLVLLDVSFFTLCVWYVLVWYITMCL